MEKIEKAQGKKKKPLDLPTVTQIEAELKAENHRKEYSRVMRTTVFALLVVTAAAAIVAVLMFPVLQIKGMGMSNTLNSGDVVVAMGCGEYARGDVIAFYFDDTLLVKRVVAVGGDTVDKDDEGNVLVNGTLLDEPYAVGKKDGGWDISLPYQVPAEELFVLGDNREASTDSRTAAMGTVEQDAVVGKLLLRVWPLGGLGAVK